MKKKKMDQEGGRLTPKISSERARQLMTDPQAYVICGNGNPLSVRNGVGYPDSVLTVTKRKAGVAFTKTQGVIKAGKK